MRKIIALTAIFALGCSALQAQDELDDIFNEIDFEETKSNLEEVDVNEFVRDLTEDFISINEIFTDDSLMRSEEYYNARTLYLQEMISKPATDCFDKNSLNNLKSTTFSKISNELLNPYYFDLKELAEAKTEEKELMLEEATVEANEIIAELEKEEENVTVPLIKTVVKERLKFFEELIENQEDHWMDALSVMKDNERKRNLTIKDSLEPVEGAEFGDETCYILERKKKSSSVASASTTDSSTSVD